VVLRGDDPPQFYRTDEEAYFEGLKRYSDGFFWMREVMPPGPPMVLPRHLYQAITG
jgi:hypothetical protein